MSDNDTVDVDDHLNIDGVSQSDSPTDAVTAEIETEADIKARVKSEGNLAVIPFEDEQRERYEQLVGHSRDVMNTANRALLCARWEIGAAVRQLKADAEQIYGNALVEGFAVDIGMSMTDVYKAEKISSMMTLEQATSLPMSLNAADKLIQLKNAEVQGQVIAALEHQVEAGDLEGNISAPMVESLVGEISPEVHAAEMEAGSGSSSDSSSSASADSSPWGINSATSTTHKKVLSAFHKLVSEIAPKASNATISLREFPSDNDIDDNHDQKLRDVCGEIKQEAESAIETLRVMAAQCGRVADGRSADG